MNSTKPDLPISISKQTFRISLLLLLLLSACSPAIRPVTSEPSPTSTPEGDPVYPYYLPLTFKPDDQPQTINGVTTTIDWAYADESRVAIHYTISGLDWPEGAFMEPTQTIQMTSETVPDIWKGGMGGYRSPVEQGVITGEYDQRLVYGALDQQKNPNIRVDVDIPVEGPTSVGTFRFNLDLPVLPGKKIENINQTVVANNVSMTFSRRRNRPDRRPARTSNAGI